MASVVADCEATVALALALYVQGQPADALHLLGDPQTAQGRSTMLPVLAALAAATDALTAAIGDDADRGRLAVMALEQRAAEYAEASREFARRTERNAGQE
jgi:hypothetical protein